MSDRVSPGFVARLAGVFYLVSIVAGISNLIVINKIVVDGDGAATVRNILASESSYRLAFGAELTGTLSYVAVTALLYILLRPVSKTVSLMAAFFSLIGCAVGAAVSVAHLVPLVILGNGNVGAGLGPSQVNAIVSASFRVHGLGTTVSLLFFGVYCSLVGYLLFRSTYFPKIVGILFALAGLNWLVTSFATFVSPPFADYLSNNYVDTILGVVGEGSLMIWLLVMGVNVEKWEAAAR